MHKLVALVALLSSIAACDGGSVGADAQAYKKKTQPPPPISLGALAKGQKTSLSCPFQRICYATYQGTPGDAITVSATLNPEWPFANGSVGVALTDASLHELPPAPTPDGSHGAVYDAAASAASTIDGSANLKTSFGLHVPSSGLVEVELWFDQPAGSSQKPVVDALYADLDVESCAPMACSPSDGCTPRADLCGGITDCSHCTPDTNCNANPGGRCYIGADCCSGICTSDGVNEGICWDGPLGTGGGGGGGPTSPCQSDADCPGGGGTCVSGACVNVQQDPGCVASGSLSNGAACCVDYDPQSGFCIG